MIRIEEEYRENPCPKCTRKLPARACVKGCKEIKDYDDWRIEKSRKKQLIANMDYSETQHRAWKHNRGTTAGRVEHDRRRQQQERDDYSQLGNQRRWKKEKQEEKRENLQRLHKAGTADRDPAGAGGDPEGRGRSLEAGSGGNAEEPRSADPAAAGKDL